MALNDYGVLKGFVVDTKLGTGASPHYQVRVVDSTDDWRIAINVKSQAKPSDVLYFIDTEFNHPICTIIDQLPVGFTSKKNNIKIGLDFIRSNVFNVNQMKPLPFNLPGADNDLNEFVDKYMQLAHTDEQAIIYAFGEKWPETNEKDKYFGFRPQKGIHDIHMNQGNSGEWIKDNGIYQDGAIIFQFKNTKKWVAIFLAFQSQSFHTDDKTGNPIDNPIPQPQPTDPDNVVPPHQESPDICIIGAFIDPDGDDTGKEMVYLFNRGQSDVNLNKWCIADIQKKKTMLDGISIKKLSCQQIKLGKNGAQLSNNGGIISLLDPKGIKQHGVSYTQKNIERNKVVLF
jgi:uncharacterized protein YukJ